MSVDLTLNIAGDDEAKKRIGDKLAQCDPHRLAVRVAVVTSRRWRSHLAAKPHNKHGYPSTGFWEDAGRRVVGVAQGGTAVLTSDKLGLRQRLHGGTIRPVNRKYITIPICAEAYGTTAADWGKGYLTLVIMADGKKFLALWLGDPSVAKKFTGTVGAAMKRIFKRKQRMSDEGRDTGVPTHETLSKAVSKFRGSFEQATAKRPDVIVLKGSSGHTAARAERHGNLKFLFVLKQSVDQAADPSVIPPDLGDVALNEVVEATK